MSDRLDLIVKNGTVVLGTGRLRVAVGVKDGKVVALGPEELLPPAKEEINAAGLFVLPGVVDSEAHPGCYVPFRHDMTTESKAAACAGITTWGIQAPSTRLGTEPFKEVVKSADVVSFTKCFDSAGGSDRISEPSRLLPDLHARNRRAGKRNSALCREAGRHLIQALSADAWNEGVQRRRGQ